MKYQTHSPTPWSVMDDVKCVNHFPALVEALQIATEAMRLAQASLGGQSMCKHGATVPYLESLLALVSPSSETAIDIRRIESVEIVEEMTKEEAQRRSIQ